MADRRYKLIGKGLVGDCDFLVEDLTNGDYIQWDSTAEKWVTTTITVDNTPDALYWNDVDIKAQTVSSGVDITGTLVATGIIEAGQGTGSVAMTTNDGYGNANLTFNHRQGSPDTTGSSARIESPVDSATGAMYFELKGSTTSGVPVQTDPAYTMTLTDHTFYVGADVVIVIRDNELAVQGNTGDNPFISFHNDAGTLRKGYIQSGTSFVIRSEDHGDDIYIQGEDAGGGVVTHLQLDPDAHLIICNQKEAFDVSDSWLRLNQAGAYTSGVYTPNKIRLDGQLSFSDTDTIDKDVGNYGNLSASGTNAWDGWSIINDTTLMMSATDNRIYNDLNNENYAQFVQNSVFRLYGNNIEAIECTTGGEVLVDSLGAAAHHISASNASGDITVSTSAASGGANGNIWFRY